MKSVVFHRLAPAELDKAIAFYERKKRGLGLDLQPEGGYCNFPAQKNEFLLGKTRFSTK